MSEVDADAPLHVLVVCTANICRSAYAHVRAESMLGSTTALVVSSAGTWGFEAAPMEQHMAHEAARRGLDASAFRSRRLSLAMIDAADLILTAATEHRTFVLEERPNAFRRTFTLGQFAHSIDELDGDLRGRPLIGPAWSRRLPPPPGSDVQDPIGRGAEAAAACAQQLDGLLARILPRLIP